MFAVCVFSDTRSTSAPATQQLVRLEERARARFDYWLIQCRLILHQVLDRNWDICEVDLHLSLQHFTCSLACPENPMWLPTFRRLTGSSLRLISFVHHHMMFQTRQSLSLW